MSMHRNKLISAAVATAITTTVLIPTANAEDTISEEPVSITTADVNEVIENETIDLEINDEVINEEITEETIETPAEPAEEIVKTPEEVNSEENVEFNDTENNIVEKNDQIKFSDEEVLNNEIKEVNKDIIPVTQPQDITEVPKTANILQEVIKNYQPTSHVQEVQKHAQNLQSQAQSTSDEMQKQVTDANDRVRNIALGITIPAIAIPAISLPFIQFQNIDTNAVIKGHVNHLTKLLEDNKIPVHDIIAQSPKEVKQAIAPYYTAPAKPVQAVENVTYASQKVTPPAPAPSKSQKAVGFAHSRIGTPYVYGGTTDSGYDCSGFVQAAYRDAGVNIPRTTYEQAVYGRSVSRAELQPGDLIFYGNGGPSTSYHVAMYVGNGQVIHSPQSGDRVKKAPMDMMRISAMQRPV